MNLQLNSWTLQRLICGCSMISVLRLLPSSYPAGLFSFNLFSCLGRVLNLKINWSIGSGFSRDHPERTQVLPTSIIFGRQMLIKKIINSSTHNLFFKPPANLISNQNFFFPPCQCLLLFSASMAICGEKLGLAVTEYFLV